MKYNDLYSFYRSEEWESLLQLLKQERVNDNEEIICEYCGKPIIKKFDCIGHHKIKLTEENVNNAEISLNPDNIAFVHHRCHNLIHEKLKHTSPKYYSRDVWLVYGSPLSGKTTWVKNNMNAGDLVIDMDNIWQCVSGCERYVKPDRLKGIVFKVRDTLLDSIRYRFGKWDNCYIIGGYPLPTERERLCRELGAREIFIECSKEECIRRLFNAEDNRNKDEWITYIDNWFARYSPPL